MPSQSPPGCVRNVVKRSVKSPANGGERPAPALPAGGAHRAPDLRRASAGMRAARRRKNEPITKTVMNVVSLVANDAREQRADQRRVVLARLVEEAPDRRPSARA